MRIYKRYQDHKEDHDGACEFCNNIWPCDVTVAYNDGFREIPELLTIDEIKDFLGVSRTRVYLLLEKPEFPKPALMIPRGRLYRKVEIEEFLNNWNRQPGRPKAEKSYKGRWVEDVEEL